jgi:hypothetical protein
MIERRSFMIACGWMTAGLAAPRTGNPDVSAAVLPRGSQEVSKTLAIALRVQGWDVPEPEEDAAGSIWIGMGSSWRATWR